MNDFFRFDTDEERLALLIRARKVALSAIQKYNLEWDNIQFIQLSDTITYKIETSTDNNYLLRIHSDRLSREEIRSELLLLQALNKSKDLNVPEGMANCDGIYVLDIETETGYRRPYITMMRWIEGEKAAGEFTDSQAYNMGVLMSRLHEAAKDFNPPSDFVRPTWGVESFKREMAKLERYYERFLSEEGWKLYQDAAEKVVSQLTTMLPSEHNYGLIHADLHTGNMVFRDNQPYPIDFGRCGYGYYLYDMAGTILELWPKHRWMLIQGYESIRKLETDYIRDLECFFVMFMIENTCHHSSDPRETTSLIDEQKYAQAYIREYLNGNPFLFEVIEPVNVD
ncbi:Ser/Thr protein kinase RdoA (MazF antagonist) [Paenibacillus xylanexedens]|uniref:phosphotransferase enzyme family protein n=1 Tax=Paenibacillus xylanexedens TaxID=528191 RepID=UPI0020A13F38|nr:phosphotransferase [Paenibacillus xylanexedens]MCP1427477.1 Ser/Thr protein kinase RdoA (MazF antagonist) [Paenibacillus xylanexedens]